MKPRRRLAALAACAVGATSLTFFPSGPASAASAGCTLAPTDGTVTRTIGSRRYTLNVPAGLTATQVPLLLALHGAFSTSDVMESFSGFTPFAAERKFIVAYPQGAPNNSGYWDLAEGSADVTFLRQVVADIAQHWCVDASHVHATGWSRGGVMSLRLACDADDLFASVTSYAGADPTIFGEQCNPSRPVGVGIFAGALDFISIVPVNLMARDVWIERNGCPTTPEVEQVVVAAETYGPCDGGVQVVWRLYLQSHNWPFGADADDMLNRMWAFFQANPLPSGA